MTQTKKILKTCSRGHVFSKSSNCPVCPTCWPGRYRTKIQSDFPEKISAPALRALHAAKIVKLAQVAKYTEKDLLNLHGMGPKAIDQLRVALRAKKLKFLK